MFKRKTSILRLEIRMTDATPELVAELASKIAANTAEAVAKIAAVPSAVDVQPVVDAVAAQTAALNPVA
jgi:hypothetical protein